jgi:anti-sigma regulatory factor (Ser/Thr protein kinase)
VSGSSAAGAAAHTLVIAPDAACASVARRHVADVLRVLGRPELIDAASLGVTELATNAALHARTSATISVRLLPDGQVRIDVGDRSPVMPHEHPNRPTSAVGRGLRLVESLGRWGVDPLLENGRQVGKIVWFSPSDHLGPSPPVDRDDRPDAAHGDARGVVGRYLTAHDAPAGSGTTTVEVRLLNFPLQVFVEAREHHDELLRELTLLSLRPPEALSLRPPEARHARGPLPQRLNQLVDLLGRRFGASGERGHQSRDSAIARGDLVADLTYQVTPGAVAALVHLDALMDEADRYCDDGWLLTMPCPELVVRFRHWYTDEFARQLAGRSPTPWDGRLSLPEHF